MEKKKSVRIAGAHLRTSSANREHRGEACVINVAVDISQRGTDDIAVGRTE